MKTITMQKRVFTFTLGDSPVVKTMDDIDTLSDSDKERILKVYENWLAGEANYEREWRNGELDKTDKLLLVDSTYGSSLVRGSYMESDILDYRAKLRSYNLTTDPRPIRPDWFK
jgi:hypothetical protein